MSETETLETRVKHLGKKVKDLQRLQTRVQSLEETLSMQQKTLETFQFQNGEDRSHFYSEFKDVWKEIAEYHKDNKIIKELVGRVEGLVERVAKLEKPFFTWAQGTPPSAEHTEHISVLLGNLAGMAHEAGAAGVFSQHGRTK